MTRAHPVVPLRRVVQDRRGLEYIVEVRTDTLTMRPLRRRRGGPADVAVAWGSIYTRALLSRPVARRRRTVSRGLLALGAGR